MTRNRLRKFLLINIIREAPCKVMGFKSLQKQALSALILSPAIFFLASCASAPPAPPSYELTFQHLPRLQIMAGSIVLKSVYQPDETKNLFDTKKPQNPTMIVKQWVQDRLERQPASSAKLVLTIIDGHVEVTQKEEAAVFGLIASQKQVFTANLVVDVAYSASGAAASEEMRVLRVKIASNQSVFGPYSLNILDKAYFMLISDLAGEFDTQMRLVLEKLKIM